MLAKKNLWDQSREWAPRTPTSLDQAALNETVDPMEGQHDFPKLYQLLTMAEPRASSAGVSIHSPQDVSNSMMSLDKEGGLDSEEVNIGGLDGTQGEMGLETNCVDMVDVNEVLLRDSTLTNRTVSP